MKAHNCSYVNNSFCSKVQPAALLERGAAEAVTGASATKSSRQMGHDEASNCVLNEFSSKLAIILSINLAQNYPFFTQLTLHETSHYNSKKHEASFHYSVNWREITIYTSKYKKREMQAQRKEQKSMLYNTLILSSTRLGSCLLQTRELSATIIVPLCAMG
jgi:hypothetical protein